MYFVAIPINKINVAGKKTKKNCNKCMENPSIFNPCNSAKTCISKVIITNNYIIKTETLDKISQHLGGGVILKDCAEDAFLKL